LGRVFGYQGRYGAALNAEQDALKNWRDLGERAFWLAEIQGNYGNALTLIGRGDQAGKDLNEALSVAREIKNDALTAQILNFQGDSFFYRGDFKAAAPLYQQAAQVAAHTTDREEILLAKFNAAKIAVREGRAQGAVSTLRSVADQADKAGLKHLSVECSLYLAQALIAAKDYSAARSELDHSLSASDKLGLRASTAKTQYLIGETLRLSGNPSEASRHYSEAHRILDEIRKEAGTEDVLKRADLATVYQESARQQTATK
jgi:tetratricopeptide (TPR) repeat protein